MQEPEAQSFTMQWTCICTILTAHGRTSGQQPAGKIAAAKIFAHDGAVQLQSKGMVSFPSGVLIARLYKVRTYACMHARVHVCMYLYLGVFVCVCVWEGGRGGVWGERYMHTCMDAETARESEREIEGERQENGNSESKSGGRASHIDTVRTEYPDRASCTGARRQLHPVTQMTQTRYFCRSGPIWCWDP